MTVRVYVYMVYVATCARVCACKCVRTYMHVSMHASVYLGVGMCIHVYVVYVRSNGHM